MLSPAMSLTAILILSILLAIVSTIAGALWWRVRSLPMVEAVRLARALASKRRALEDLLDRVAALEAMQAASPAPPLPVPASSREPSLRVDPPIAAVPPGPRLIAVPDLSGSSRPDPTSAEPDERFADLIELARSGVSASEIARETGRPIGHVELILNLGRTPPGPPTPRERP